MKVRPIFSIFMILVLWSGVFAGCSKEEPPATEATVTTVSYMLTHIDSGAFSYSADAFRTSGTLDVHSDGTATLVYAEQTTQLLYDDSNMWSAEDPQTLHAYQRSGMVLVLDYFADTLSFLETGETVTVLE